MSLFAELNNLMAKYRFRPKKRFSQHFVINESALQRIVDAADLGKRDRVLEIGAGTGFLTRELCKYSRVFAVEIDKALCGLLKDELKSRNLKMHCGDFLKMELPEFNKVVSVPPYNISRKIMLKLLRKGFERAVLVFQDEFANKLIAEPGFPHYSAISVLCQYKTTPEIVGTIAPSCFFPKPKARSVIVRLTPTEKSCALDEALFFRFVIELFRHRKKNVENAILDCKKFMKEGFGISSAKAVGALREFDLKEKVDVVEVKTFTDMFNVIYSASGIAE